MSDGVKKSLLGLKIGLLPKSLLELLSKTDKFLQTIACTKESLKYSRDSAKCSHRLSKAWKASRASQNYMIHTFQISEKVGVNKTLIKDACKQSQ